MSHVRDCFRAVIVAEFGSRLLAGVHPGDTGATGAVRRPLGDVVDLPRNDDPAVVPPVVQGDLLARHGTWRLGRSVRRPELAGDARIVGLGGAAEVPRSQSLRRQRRADLAGVVSVDPGIVLAAALVVGEGGADTNNNKNKQRLLLG